MNTLYPEDKKNLLRKNIKEKLGHLLGNEFQKKINFFFRSSNYVYVDIINVGIDGALHNLFVLASKTPFNIR